MTHTYSLTQSLINRTNAKEEVRSYDSSSITTSYYLLGGFVNIKTEKREGYSDYDTTVSFSYGYHAIANETFAEWLNTYVCNLLNLNPADYNKTWQRKTSFKVAEYEAERASEKRKTDAHTIGLAIANSYALTILNKYVECIFNDVEAEVITRQIEELTSQLATLTTTN